MIVDKMKSRLDTLRRSIDRWIWLRRQGAAIERRGVFVFGVQRSGTTMLARCLENSPEFDVYGEMSLAFENSILKGLDIVQGLIQASKRPFVAFKPLTDSHRVTEIMSVDKASRAIWMYRRPEDRANSAVTKFGDTNLRFLQELIDTGPTNRWEARGVSANTLRILRRLDPASMDAYSAAGAFWFLRNQLFFDQQLQTNPNVLLLKYEMLVKEPEPTMRKVCNFIGCKFDPLMIKDIHSESVGRRASRLSPEISSLCSDMMKDLDRIFRHQWQFGGDQLELVGER